MDKTPRHQRDLVADPDRLAQAEARRAAEATDRAAVAAQDAVGDARASGEHVEHDRAIDQPCPVRCWVMSVTH